MASTNILVFEDNPIDQELVKALLDERGLPHTMTNTGTKAWDLLLSQPFDLLITDIFLRDESPKREFVADGGIALIARARNLANFKHANWLQSLSILAVTASAPTMFFDALEQARSLGADQCLRKPFSEADFHKTLDSLLGPKGEAV